MAIIYLLWGHYNTYFIDFATAHRNSFTSNVKWPFFIATRKYKLTVLDYAEHANINKDNG